MTLHPHKAVQIVETTQLFPTPGAIETKPKLLLAVHVHARISGRDFGNAGAFLGLTNCQIPHRPRFISHENTAVLRRA